MINVAQIWLYENGANGQRCDIEENRQGCQHLDLCQVAKGARVHGRSDMMGGGCWHRILLFCGMLDGLVNVVSEWFEMTVLAASHEGSLGSEQNQC